MSIPMRPRCQVARGNPVLSCGPERLVAQDFRNISIDFDGFNLGKWLAT